MFQRGLLKISAAAGLALALTGVLGPSGPSALAAFTLHSGYVQVTTSGPLSVINVGADTTLQVVDRRVSTGGEFHYAPIPNCTADFATFVSLGNKLYGPNPQAPWRCSPSSMNGPNYVYTPVSQTTSGTGSFTAPYTVVTTVRLTVSINLIQTINYVAGQSSLRETNTLSNSGATTSAKVFEGAEPDPGSIDNASGYFDYSTGSVGASNPVDSSTLRVLQCGTGGSTPYHYDVFFTPITPWQHSVVDRYDHVFNDISASDTGASLPDTFNTACGNPAAAVEWDVAVNAGQSVSLSKSVTFTSNVPQLHPGRVTGKASCNAYTAHSVTCSHIPSTCTGCGSSFNFLLPAICAAGTITDLQDRPCSGSFVGQIEGTAFTFTITSGGITPTPKYGGMATFHGFGRNLVLNLLQVNDNDVTGVDTIQLSGPKLNYQWTCTATPLCLEVTSSG